MKHDDENSDAADDSQSSNQNSDYLMLNQAGFENTATSGKTALMIAVLAKNVRMVGHMLKNGFDPDSRDKLGFTALMYAAKTGNLELCQTLIFNGANPRITDCDHQTAEAIALEAGHLNIAKFLRDFELGLVPQPEVSLLAETLADGYVIAVRTNGYGILPVIAIVDDNSRVIVITSAGEELTVSINDCEEELAVRADKFADHFTAPQLARLRAA